MGEFGDKRGNRGGERGKGGKRNAYCLGSSASGPDIDVGCRRPRLGPCHYPCY